jgi:hypothetical protein
LGPSKEAAVATTERTETSTGLRRHVIYLIYLYQRHPERVVEVGQVHLDPLEEYSSE